MARSSPRKKPVVSYKEEGDETAKKPSAARAALGSLKSAAAKLAAKPAPKRMVIDEGAEEAKPEATKPQQTKKRKTTKTNDQDAMPLADRTAVSSLKKAMYIGAHVSAAGGVNNSITNAVHIGANSFALFLKSQRKWDNPPINPEAKSLFMSGCSNHGYNAAEHALPHGSYLVNLAQSDPAKATQAYNAFLDDLNRCEQLGIKLYNFHPGSTLGDSREAAIGRIAAQLNKSHKATSSVITVLENMAGSGNTIGSTWEDLRDIIALVDDKSRVGVCIDTCHAFAAGHDLRTPEAFRKTLDEFRRIVGIKYLKAFHLNDSKAPFGSSRDLHANIGTGFLGLRAFHSVMNEDSFCGMPMVLETPIDKKDAKGKSVEDKQVWADEIKLLESLVGMDADGEKFTALEKELQARGAGERQRIQDQVKKKAAKGGGKKFAAGKKRKKGDDTDDETD
ncbi:DNA-(apurinic or apyrimidinic site) lyase [Cordyceps fumosorosea ARSEF 2679]|uniref:Apurinic-apyrimidinic endonuclease 1 n=1 Tax=Cordyceps fumosorosea (strain ARSEF 2679) TaxID=1081104 RepID=A0A162J5L7_CORFA|nr:DNA-(apurinic or apyrimidinic site) lyase [Cordyceps fumosorosea ARSEF 2679]OAA64062.1 DNA-(apurinic or apyrimidinic site) lyase [Cordyceps fumosorosea ARSEF 2679]